MDLASLYREVAEAISRLDFESIWPGFEPLKFALYDDESCFFDGRFVEKTEAFCANTSIVYNGEQIAIWKVAEELETPVLASKIVHEMFHGYQTAWDCWPNELEALFGYEYSAENLCLKLRENELLLDLLGGFDEAAFRELIALRKLRSERFPYQFEYELKTEEIEGTANYVEWQVLKQLDEEKALMLTERMRAAVTDPERLFPIRISCYFTGALAVNAMLGAGVYSFEASDRPVMLRVMNDAAPSQGDFAGKDELMRAVSGAIGAFNAETEEAVKCALERNEVLLEGPLELVFVNIYNARRLGDYLTSTFFVMYRENGADKMLPGDFVIKMKDNRTIERVYKWR